MKDAKEYTVVYADTSAKFTATDGTPAKVGLDATQIPAGTKTEVRATLLDANGVILSHTDLDNGDSSKGKVTSAVTLTKGYQDGTNLYLPAVGDTATIKVTYHTGTFGTDGKETGLLEDTFTVTAVDPSLVNYNFAVTISNTTPAWTADSFKANTNLPMGADKKAYFRITDDKGKDVTDKYSDYKVESADKTKVIVSNDKLVSATTPVYVHGVAEGTTYILVKKDDKTVATLPVTVLGKPVATTLELNKTSVSVCTNSAVDETVLVTVKDQYGDTMNPASNVTVSLLAAPKDSTVTAGNVAGMVNTATAGKVVISGSAFGTDTADKDLGSYTLKLTVKRDNKELTRSLNVNVVKATAKAQSYAVRIDTPEVDTTVGNANDYSDTKSAIKISVARLANGAAMDEYDGSADDKKVIYTIKDAKGNVVANVGDTISGSVDKITFNSTDVVSCAAVSSNSSAVNAGGYQDGVLTVRPYNVSGSSGTDKKITKNLAAGTYTVQAKVIGDEGKVVTVNSSFTIKDTQDTRASFKILDNKFGDSTTIADAFADKKLVKVFYDGEEQDITSSEVKDIKGVVLTTGSSKGGAYLKTLKLMVKVAEQDGQTGKFNYVQITLNVNDQIATCAADDITE